MRDVVSIPLQAVGGLSIEQAAKTPALGAQLTVIGAPLAIADREFTPGADDDELYRVIREFVGSVKGAAASSSPSPGA